MITELTKMGICNGAAVEVSELYGLSTDTKPTDVANGSCFQEMDTGKLFVFDEANKIWYPM